jgi:glycosyltransferase involved in cell wall biosynthesis
LHYAKGFDLVIPAIVRLKSEGFKFVWTIVGEGPQRNKLEKLISKYQLEDTVSLVGLQENPYPYIAESNLYLQSSRYEGFCITLSEALVLHKPILTTNFSGAKEQIIHGETGFIVEAKSNDIYNGLRILLSDRKLRDKYSENIQKYFYRNKDGQLDQINKIF